MNERKSNIGTIRLKKLTLISLILIFGLFARGVSAEYASIGKGALYILGVGLSADPAQQTAPINTGTAVNTRLVLPNIDFGGSIPNLLLPLKAFK